MSSGITNDPTSRARVKDSLVAEYTLSLADHHALDMFVYDTVLCRAFAFRLRFYAKHLLVGGVWSAFTAAIVWGLVKALDAVGPPLGRDPRVPLWLGCGSALLVFAIVLSAAGGSMASSGCACSSASARATCAIEANLSPGAGLPQAGDGLVVWWCSAV
jgi:hypothetical protein